MLGNNFLIFHISKLCEVFTLCSRGNLHVFCLEMDAYPENTFKTFMKRVSGDKHESVGKFPVNCGPEEFLLNVVFLHKRGMD